MATTSRDELLKTDFLKLADPNTGKISKVIAPNALQVGLDDEQFRSSLTVKGSTTVERSLVVQQGITGSLTQVSDGVDFIQAGSNVTVTKNSNGSLTIAASTVGDGEPLTLGNSFEFNSGDTEFDGTVAQQLDLNFVSKGGLDTVSTAGVRINFDNLVTGTPVDDDYVVFGDESNATQYFPKRVTIANLTSAVVGSANFTAPTTVSHAITFGAGIEDTAGAASDWDNSAAVTLAVDLKGTDSGLNFAGGKLQVDPSQATATTTVDLTNDYLLIYDDSATATRKVALQYVAGVAPNGLTLGNGLTPNGTTYDGSSAESVAVLAGDGTLSVGATGITVNSVPNSLSDGVGIQTLSYDGSGTATVAIDRSTNGGLNFNGSDELQLDINNMSAGTTPLKTDELVVSFGANTSRKVDIQTVVGVITDGFVSNTVWVDENVKAYTTSSISIDSDAGNAESHGEDVFFYVSGSVGNDTSPNANKSVFGGDVFATGSITAVAGLSGSLTRLSDGSPYLIAGTNITLTTSSAGAITITAAGVGQTSGSISNVTQADPGVVTTTEPHGLSEAQGVTITSVVGMTELNGNRYYADVLTDSTFSLYQDSDLTTTVDTTGFTAYVSDGEFTGESAGGSISFTSGSTTVTAVSSVNTSELGIIQDLGSNAIAITGSIGSAEDGSYIDGLFTDFTANTPVGTAIDRFNEVLKGLAPGAAPSLADIGIADTGTNAKLSFGTAQSITGYTNVQPSGLTPASSLSDVDINGTYQSTTSGDDIRRACFAGSTTINGRLNSEIAADSPNYPQYSVGNGDQGTLKLFVNDNTTEIHSVDLSSFASGDSVNGNGTGFLDLSAADPGHFSDGSEFDTFKHRTGSFSVDPSDQRDGWNYARVVHTIGSSDSVTNYVEWVNDSNADALSADTFAFDSLAMTGMRKLSGARYFTAGTAEYRARALNAYKNIYPTTNITFNGTRCAVSAQSFPSIDYAGGEDETKQLHITGSATINTDPILNNSISVSLNVPAVLKSDLSSVGSQNINGIFLYNLSNTSTVTSETFRSEDYRVASGSYSAQADVTDAGNAWDSALHMSGTNTGHTDGLLFYNSALRAPTAGGVSGDFRNSADGGSILNGPSNNVDYSGITTGLRTFYRYFQNNSGGSKSNFSLTINGTGTIVDQSTALTGNNIHVLIKLPTTDSSFETGWMDLAVAFATNQTDNGDGCLDGSLDSSLNATNNATFGVESAGSNEYIVVKVEADASWTGNISAMSISWT